MFLAAVTALSLRRKGGRQMVYENIVRSAHDRSHPFVRLSNAAMQNNRLSYRARGLLAFVLSKPDGFSWSAEGLQQHGLEGRDAIREALRELKALSYCREVRERGAAGRFATRLVFVESPSTGNQAPDEPSIDDGKPAAGRPTTENQSLGNRRRETSHPIKQLSGNDCSNDCVETKLSLAGESEPQSVVGNAGQSRPLVVRRGTSPAIIDTETREGREVKASLESLKGFDASVMPKVLQDLADLRDKYEMTSEGIRIVFTEWANRQARYFTYQGVTAHSFRNHLEGWMKDTTGRGGSEYRRTYHDTKKYGEMKF